MDTAEDPASQPDRAGEPAARHLAGRIRRRRPAHAEGDLHPRRADVPRPDSAVGGGHPDDRAGVRKLDGRRCLHPRHVRPRRDDQGALEGVPGGATAGEDGHRRGVRRRVAGRRRNACPHFGSGGLLRRRRARRHPHRPSHRRPSELAQTRAGCRARRRAAVRRRRAGRHRPDPICGSRSIPGRSSPASSTAQSSTSSRRCTARRW